MDTQIIRAEYEEFKRRMEEANHRQDKRLEALERTVEQIHALATSVEKLALSIKSMADEQRKQGERLETLEARDGEMWRKVIGYILTAIASAGVTVLVTRLGA